MPRRVSLPGAAELFRSTHAADEPARARSGPADPAPEVRAPEVPAPEAPAPEVPALGSGRVRHDEKITVYVSRDELLALEQARLTLRAEHAMAVDRGRIVREAIAALLDDLERHGPDSELVRRLAAS